jgi:hypothetical protein
VADGTGLENRKGFTLLVGSNPTPSALKFLTMKLLSSVSSGKKCKNVGGVA